MGKCCRMVLLHRRFILEQSTVYLPQCNWRTVCPFRLPTAEEPALSPQDCAACWHLSLWQSFFLSNYYIGCLRAYCSVQACYAQVPNIMSDDVKFEGTLKLLFLHRERRKKKNPNQNKTKKAACQNCLQVKKPLPWIADVIPSDCFPALPIAVSNSLLNLKAPQAFNYIHPHMLRRFCSGEIGTYLLPQVPIQSSLGRQALNPF